MISAEFAAKQIKRLDGMWRYPKEPEALKDRVKALQKAASEKQAEAVISSFVKSATTETPCPFPAEIEAAVNALNAKSFPDPLCHICAGDGWRKITRSGYSGADRCLCWAPRPAPKVDYVPLAGSLGYVPPPPLATREEIRESLERITAETLKL